MPETEPVSRLDRAAFYLAFAASLAVLFSIAASQLLLALAFPVLLFSRARLRLPRIWLPLAVFIAGTLISLATSEDPTAGLPQLRKLFVFLLLPVVFSAFRHTSEAARLLQAWFGAAALSALVGLGQFAGKLAEARRLRVGFYDYYVSERISGFMSHWMTFAGELMIVGLLLASWWLFAPRPRPWVRWLAAVVAALMAAALLLNMTRSVWLATAVGGCYLVWFWKRRLLIALPLLLAGLLWLGPEPVRARLVSLVRPKPEVDSNLHRLVCWRTGWRMIQAHPWLGLGPEMVRLRFQDYLPPDAPQPLPTGWYGHLHNTYLHYAAERGVPTALAVLWLLAQAFFELAGAARRLPKACGELRFLLHGSAAVVLAVAVSGLFEHNLGDSEVLMLFLAVLACGYLAVRQSCALLTRPRTE